MQRSRPQLQGNECRWLAPLFIFFGALTAGCVMPADAKPRHADLERPLIETEYGAVRGISRNGVDQFLGIPYAAPPVGELRWNPPQAPAKWHAALDASHFGESCPQSTPLGVFSDASSTEDCLTLNVFVGRNATQPQRSKRPVLVWIHGGGLVAGGSRDYDATALAKGGAAGSTVVVTINHRLGLLGYLAHPALDNEGHVFANYGLMDQKAAVRWVRQNIDRFGGDPNNITVGGHSSGGSSVAALMVSQSHNETFQKAIFQSGLFLPILALDKAEAKGKAFSEAAGCEDESPRLVADCLRRLPVDKIIALQDAEVAGGSYLAGTVGDGTLLPLFASSIWDKGKFAHIPVLSGTTLDEGAFEASVLESRTGVLSQSAYEAMVKKRFGGANGASAQSQSTGADAILSRRRYSGSDGPALAWSAIITDTHVCPVPNLYRAIARFAPIYAYEFADRSAPWYYSVQSFSAGAAHTSDIQYLFPRWHGGSHGVSHGLNPAQQALSDELVTGWTNFMYNGTPNAPGSGGWPRYTVETPDYLIENVGGMKVMPESKFRAEHDCDFWDQFLAHPRPKP